MDQAEKAHIEFDLAELKTKVGELFQIFVAGQNVTQSVMIRTDHKEVFTYRLKRSVDLLIDFVAFYVATVRANGEGTYEVSGIARSIVALSEEYYAALYKDLEKLDPDFLSDPDVSL